MAAVSTLFPVFFMLALGFVAHRRDWVSVEQKSGVSSAVFKVLFPIMIFNLAATAEIDMSRIAVVGFAFVVYVAAIFLGRLVAPFTGKKYAKFSPYLLSSEEGGSVALPLYLSIVGQSSNTVLFDLAGTAACFIVIAIMVSREGSKGASSRDILLSIVTNSFIIAVTLGLVVNLSGAYAALIASPFGDMYTKTATMATQSIGPMILFCLGYDFRIDRETIAPLAKLALVKTAYYAVVIALFFLLFPALMADKVFVMAVVIYLMSPTGTGLVPVISPLFKDDDDAAFASAFIPLYLVITLVVYTCIVVFVA